MAQLSLKKTIARLLRWTQYPNVKRSTASTSALYAAQRTDTGVNVSFGVGSNGDDHGIWSSTLSKWIVRGNTAGNFFVGDVRIGKYSGNATKVGSAYTAGTITYWCNSGTVVVRLSNMTFGTISGNTNIATIPAGVRPLSTVYGVFYTGASYTGAIYVDGNGNIGVNAGVSGKSGLYGSVTFAAYN
jgi:hypothetical protein